MFNLNLKTLDLMRQRKYDRNTRLEVESKKLENRVYIELQDKLSKELMYNDSVMIEVNEKVLGEFLNRLDEKFTTLYDYSQVDKTHFIFYNKELDL